MDRIKKKYIIELEDKPFNKGNGDFLYRVKGFNSLVFDMTGINKLIPYTEPDLDAIRNEAYEKGVQDTKQHWVDAPRSCAYKLGYENGLNDAWEAARKISSMDSNTRDNVFGLVITSNIFDENTASEVIEKIRQYKQEKEEIKVGNEVKGGDEKYIVLQKYLNNIDELMVVLFNRRDGQIGTWHLYNANGAIFEKTGRHFPEIVEALKKMREE